MKNKIYDEYISNIISGNLKSTSLAMYCLGFILISVVSLIFWSLLPLKSLTNSNEVAVFIIPILILGILLIGSLSVNSNKINKLYCTEEVAKVISRTTPILDIIPIKKETLITSKCLEVVLFQLEIMLFSIVGLLLYNDNSAVDGVRGLVNILTISIVSTYTYSNIRHFKAVRELVVTPKKEEAKDKKKSEFFSFIRFTIIWFIIYSFGSITDILSRIFPNFFTNISNFITDFFIFRFLGNFYVGLTLMIITAICIIYFNYFYILKRKLKELNADSNWREL